jgi:sulfotransferase famil protein
MLVFLHIPKTGGKTMVQVLLRQFSCGEVVHLDVGGASTAGLKWQEVPMALRERAKCVYGHLPLAPAMFGDQRVQYITMLRDPIERCVSEYYYALRRPEHGLHATLWREAITLDKFVTTELVTQICNTQVRILSGADGPVQSDAFLKKALDNLREHAVLAGLTERFDETLLLCREFLGWNRLFYERTNVNRWRPALNRVSPATLAALGSMNRLDCQLYHRVQKQFELLVREHGILPRGIVALRRASRIYGFARRMLTLPLNIARDLETAMRHRRAIRG